MTGRNEHEGPRLYGEPEKAKPEVDNDNGLRGEASAAKDAATTSRTVRMNGRDVTIEES